jgi:hypothetical protein
VSEALFGLSFQLMFVSYVSGTQFFFVSTVERLAPERIEGGVSSSLLNLSNISSA